MNYRIINHLLKWPPEQTPQILTKLLSRYSKMSAQLKSQIILPEDRANDYRQWLIYLNRIDEAFELFKWDTKTNPSSFNRYDVLERAEEKEGRLFEAKKKFQIGLNLSRKKNLQKWHILNQI